MPLVVPGLQGNDMNTSDLGTNPQKWMVKLAGKKIGDNHDETTFAKGDLPKDHRVIEKGGMATMDFKPDRMNVHVDDDGTIRDVKFG